MATDQQIAGTTATLTIDRDAAARFGIQPQLIDDTLYDAFGQRQVTQYFTQLNSYHVILEVPPDEQRRARRRSTSCTSSPAPAQAVPLSTFVKVDTTPVAPLSINHQSQFPAVTISFNLAPGAALGEAVDGDQRGDARARRAADAAGHVPGHRAGVPVLAGERALSDRRGADRGLHHPGHPVRELHPAADHPVHPAVGRRRRAADADAVAATTCP